MLKILLAPIRLLILIFNWLFYPQVETPLKRFFKGAIKVTGAVVFILNHISIKAYFVTSMGIFGEILYYITAIIVFFAFFLDGIHNLRTYHVGGYLMAFDWREWNSESLGDSDSLDSYDRIGEVLAYRESRMAGMGRDKAAKLYSQTEGGLSTLSRGHNSKRALRYLNTQMNGMDRAKGLDFVKSLNKD